MHKAQISLLFDDTVKDSFDFFFLADGDPDNQFYVGLSAGNLMVSRQLEWAKKSFYNLTVQVTDGVNFDNCSVSTL